MRFGLEYLAAQVSGVLPSLTLTGVSAYLNNTNVIVVKKHTLNIHVMLSLLLIMVYISRLPWH